MASAVVPAATGDTAVFAAAMAATRVIQAVANGFSARESVLQQRIARAYLASAVLFAL